MKLACFVILCVFSVSLAAVDRARAKKLFDEVKDTELVLSDPALVKRVRKTVLRRGCNVNVCFALDGSGAVGDDFETQKQFVSLIAAIIGADDASKFAATVYGLVNENISELTKNAANFILDVTEAPFPAAPVTFISAGLGFCVNQLDGVKLASDVNKIVFLADGFSNFGPSVPFPTCDPIRCTPVEQPFDIFAVAVGFSSTRALDAITGNPSHVLKVTEWPVLLNILDNLVELICPKEIVVEQICPCKCQKKARAKKKCNKKKFRKCKVTACSSKKSRCCHK